MAGHVAAKEISAFGWAEEVEEAVDRRREALDGGIPPAGAAWRKCGKRR
jgi:hypothetical protein